MSYPYIRHIEIATEAFHLREIFNKSFAYICEPGVFEMFSSRISELAENSANAHELNSLRDLLEDIEDEKAHGTILKRKISKSSGLEKAFLLVLLRKRAMKEEDDYEIVAEILRSCSGSITQAARILGLSTRVLKSKLAKYKNRQFPRRENGTAHEL